MTDLYEFTDKQTLVGDLSFEAEQHESLRFGPVPVSLK